MHNILDFISAAYPFVLALGTAGIAVGICECADRKKAQQVENNIKTELTAGKQPRCEFEQLYNHLLIKEIMETTQESNI